MNKKAFTLVELIGTIVILGVILTIAVPSYNSYIEKTKQSKCDADERAILDAAGTLTNSCIMNNVCPIQVVDFFGYPVDPTLDNIVVRTEDDFNYKSLGDEGLPPIIDIGGGDDAIITMEQAKQTQVIMWNNNLLASDLQLEFLTHDAISDKEAVEIRKKVGEADESVKGWLMAEVGITSAWQPRGYLYVKHLIDARYLPAEYSKYQDLQIIILPKKINGITDYKFILKGRFAEFLNLCK